MKKRLNRLVATAIGCLILTHVSLHAQIAADTLQPSQKLPVLAVQSNNAAQVSSNTKRALPQNNAKPNKVGKRILGVVGLGLIGIGTYIGLDATSTELRSEVASYNYNPITGIRTPNFRVIKETKTDNAELYGGIGLGLTGVVLASYGFSK